MTFSKIAAFALVLAFGTAALAQVATSGTVYESTPMAALPPLAPSATTITTPMITFVNVSNTPVGATNATGENVAGATNATVGNVPPISVASWTAPVLIAGSEEIEASTAHQQVHDDQELAAVNDEALPVFDSGPSEPQPSVAQLARDTRQAQRPAPARVYTNADVNRQSQQSGVKK